MKRRAVAVLIPAHNEEKVIRSTIKSLLKLVSKRDIYLVDDGSTDKTVTIASKYIQNIHSVSLNKGKAASMNQGIKFFKLVEKYDYILPMDADTSITQTFLDGALPIMEADKKKEISCVVGKVIGKGQNWITTYRLWEYEVAQTIHKPAQSKENAVIVCAGCATLYRSEVFAHNVIPSETMTEDMDFTFLIHRKKLGRIVYTNDAVVVTQDPYSLKDFIKQIDRWYTGFWQCVIKHNIPWGGQMLDFEVGLLATEGLFNGILMVSLLLLIPLTIIKAPYLLATPIVVDFFFFLLPTMFLAAKRHRLKKIYLYIPLFYLMRLVSCLIFLHSFIKIVLGIDLEMKWNKITRYSI